ncbi:30S ribosomal protein S6 [Candidatus Curtissbacteria bacterium RBG_13_35_7]|uniref:Small ribosomal subunit protein bS6 n=1 Tax=Candidatus Curtissbacteria bacterium RBG_13_35_7 TaxID=1797705 RepID=A0A1F5G3R6_9BACT|nr:MAG: 30S ribosomal protein S6 [Candidatus Curtissbacteria bacterium RBG_13_35_7]
MYELMIVANYERGDSLLGRVEKAIKEAGANNYKVEKLGRKTLAYVIKKQDTAAYYLINFESEGKAIKQITDKLRLEQEDLLRYLLITKRAVKLSKKKIRKESIEVEKETAKPKPKVTVVTKTVTASKAKVKLKKGKKQQARSNKK